MAPMRVLLAMGFTLVFGFRLQAWTQARARLADLCAHSGGTTRFRAVGVLVPGLDGRGRLIRPSVSGDHGSIQEVPEIRLPEGGNGSIQRAEVQGRLVCRYGRRNPGKVQDGLLNLAGPQLAMRGRVMLTPVGTTGLADLVQNVFLQKLQRLPESDLKPLWLALWTGSIARFPLWLVDFYREAGLLHLVALSGQHVSGLVLPVHLLWVGLSGLLLNFGPPAFRRIFERVSPWVLGGLPLFAALLLCLSSQGAGSVRRTAAVAGAAVFLRVASLRTSPLQLLLSSVGLMLLWNPAVLAETSFFLSAICTTAHLSVLSEVRLKKRILKYVGISLGMPIVLFPISAFAFARVPWSAPFYGLLLGWIWDLVVIPIGFATSLFRLVIDGELWGLESALSWFWRKALQAQFDLYWAHPPQAGLFFRPTWGELGLWLMVLVAAGRVGLRGKTFARG